MNLKDLFWFKEPAANTEFKIEEEKRKTDYDVREEREAEKDFYVTENYDENLSYIKRRFSVPMNNDVIIREIKIGKNRKCFVVFIEGMVNTSFVDEAVVKPLLLPLIKDKSTLYLVSILYNGPFICISSLSI